MLIETILPTSPIKYFVTYKVLCRVYLRFSFLVVFVLGYDFTNFRLSDVSVSYLDLRECLLAFIVTWCEASGPGQMST